MGYRTWGAQTVFHIRERVLRYTQGIDTLPNLTEELRTVVEEYVGKPEIRHRIEKLPLSAKEIRLGHVKSLSKKMLLWGKPEKKPIHKKATAAQYCLALLF